MTPRVPRPKPLTFECEFKCPCGVLITFKSFRAIVESQTGAEFSCRNCRQRYRIDPKGAHPIGKEMPSETKPALPSTPMVGEAPTLRWPQPGKPPK